MSEQGLFDSPTESVKCQGGTSLVPPRPFQLERQCTRPQTVVRRIEEIKPLPEIIECGLMPTAVQLEALRACGDRPFDEPVLITSGGFLIDGYKRWSIARVLNIHELGCVSLTISREDALRRVLERACIKNEQKRFCRVVLALVLTNPLRIQAKRNQAAGGKDKHLARLPDAAHIDVRKEAARLAGVSEGTVRHVEHILADAVEQVRNAVRRDEITIYRAFKLSKLDRDQQIGALSRQLSKQSQARRVRDQIRSCGIPHDEARRLLTQLLKLASEARLLKLLSNWKGELDRFIATVEKELDGYPS